MILLMQKESLDELISHKIITEYNPDEDQYELSLNSPITGLYHKVVVKVVLEYETTKPIIENNPTISEMTLEDKFEIIKKMYPASDHWIDNNGFKHPSTASKRTGNKAQLIVKLEKLISSLGFNTIHTALAYDIYISKRGSTTIDNKMKYFKMLPTWLNNQMNIETLYEQAKLDETFMKLYIDNPFKDIYSFNANEQNYGYGFEI
jgi:hypothetical protein